MVEEKTAAIGKPVKITIFGAEALGKLPDQYNLLLDGAVDIVSNWGPSHFPGSFPMLQALDLPFLFPSATVFNQVAQDLFEKYPEIQEELGEAKMLFFQPTPPQEIQSRAKPIKKVEDFKGLKVMARGGVNAEIMQALGGVPVTMAMPEVYMALERGLLDVAPMNWEGTVSFKWFEVTKYRTDLPKGLFITTLMCSMNWDTWNSLPPEVQKVFEDLSGRNMVQFVGNTIDNANVGLLEVIKKRDQELGNPGIYVLPEAEFPEWVQAVTPVYEKWKAETEAQGLPAKALFEDILRLVDKYSK